MEQIGAEFETYRIILYYDVSSDNTLVKLKRYANMHTRMILLENDQRPDRFRTHRIAKGRNRCLNVVRNRFPEYEYMIMMDCDDRCNYFLNTPLLRKSLRRNDWDALSFNHPMGYYDSWALSIAPHVISCYYFKDNGAGVRALRARMQKTPRGELIPCVSAFNGFAIYRVKRFHQCWYDGHPRLDVIPARMLAMNMRSGGERGDPARYSKNEDCEHRFFHISAIRRHGARIMISPECILRPLRI
jgi:hypothetical protein